MARAFSPPGSEAIASWAVSQLIAYDAHPALDWFRAWEPFDTLLAADHWFDATSWAIRRAAVTLAEPWYAEPGSEPLGRCTIAFVAHPRFERRAAARGGEHFNTRVVYVASPPPPRVELGDPRWDAHVMTLAASPSEALAALPDAARRVLESWAFTGHLEIRPGGLVLHLARLGAGVEARVELQRGLPELLASFGCD